MSTEVRLLLVRVLIFSLLCVLIGLVAYKITASGLPKSLVVAFVTALIFVNVVGISIIHGMNHQAAAQDQNRLRDHVMLANYIEMGAANGEYSFEKSYQYADNFMIQSSRINNLEKAGDINSFGLWAASALGSCAMLAFAATYGVAEASGVSLLAVWR